MNTNVDVFNRLFNDFEDREKKKNDARVTQFSHYEYQSPHSPEYAFDS